MIMTKEEIVKKYKENCKTTGYAQILADLNVCKKSEILNILREAGIPLPGNPNFGKKNKEKKVEDKVEENKEAKAPEIKVEVHDNTTKCNENEPVDNVDHDNTKPVEIPYTGQSCAIIPGETKTHFIPHEVREQLQSDLMKIGAEIISLKNKYNIIEKFLDEDK